jgi:hypothetical protein
LERREFTNLASAGLCGLLGRSDQGGPGISRPEVDPAQKRLVLLGLNALARAHELSYFADGHRGASLVSAHLLIEENGLPAEARLRIEQLLDANWSKAPLCRPFPEEEPVPEQIGKIGAALAEGRGQLRQVGHNAIFAMIAIKGFRLLPAAATPQRIDGVCRLIRAIQPWRDVEPDPAVQPPAFAASADASRFILREAFAAVDRFRGFGQGYAGHMLTFGQALVELAAMGDVEWAESCRRAFCKYVTVTRQGPQAADRRIPDHAPSALRPNSLEYWQRRGEKTLEIGHVFKYPYSYYELLRRAEDQALRREWDAKAFHIF